MKIKEPDLLELNDWFEAALNQITRIDKTKKMRMRRKIRDEVYLLLTWEKPTAAVIFNRWEERMADFFKALPFGLREDLLRLLVKKLDASRP